MHSNIPATPISAIGERPRAVFESPPELWNFARDSGDLEQ